MIQINQSISGSSEKQSPNQWLFKKEAENIKEKHKDSKFKERPDKNTAKQT